MKLNFKKLLPVCLLCLLFPISRVSAGRPDIFTPEQCQAIIQYVADHGGSGVFCDWVALKRELHLPQTAKQIRGKYTYSLDPWINRSPWTAAEDQAILDGVETHGKQWTLIAKELGTGRAHIQVRLRFMRVLNPDLKKDRFTAEEDQKILAWVAENGPENWGKCARELFSDTRNRDQLRQRWADQLNPNLNKGPWTPEEDQIITRQVKTIGTKWTSIAALLPGRSDSAVQNRWKSIVKKKSLGGGLNGDQAGPAAQPPAIPIHNTTDEPIAPVPDNFTQNPPTVPTQPATPGDGDFVTDFSFTSVAPDVGSPLFDSPPISPLQSPIDWSFFNSTPNSSVAQPAPVPDGSGNNSIPNLISSAQNLPTVPTQPATSGNGDSATNFSFTPVDNNTNNNDFTLFSFESPFDQALDYNLGLLGSGDDFYSSEFK